MNNEQDALERGTGTEDIEKVRFARYHLCPVCHGIVTDKKGKHVELREGIFAHNACAEIFMKRVKAGISRANKEE